MKPNKAILATVAKGKVSWPKWATFPTKKKTRKPGDPYEFTHISIVGFDWTPDKIKHKDIIKQFGGHKRTGFILQWGCKDIGFGELSFSQVGDKLECETECMSPAFVKAALEEMFKRLVLKDI